MIKSTKLSCLVLVVTIKLGHPKMTRPTSFQAIYTNESRSFHAIYKNKNESRIFHAICTNTHFEISYKSILSNPVDYSIKRLISVLVVSFYCQKVLVLRCVNSDNILMLFSCWGPLICLKSSISQEQRKDYSSLIRGIKRRTHLVFKPVNPHKKRNTHRAK